MIIKTHSRLAQVDAKGQEIIAKVSANAGVSIEDIAAEIRFAISNMDASKAANASGWYFEANAFAQSLADKHNVSIEIAAGVISAVSPRMPWLRNKRVADEILSTFRQYSALSAMDAAKSIGLALSVNVAMAVRIARGEDIDTALSGTKRRSFYNNIVAPASADDSVTIDTWMIQAFCNVTGSHKKDGERFVKANDKALKGTGVGYFVLAEATREAARELGLKPHQTQALYWVAAAGNHNGSRTDIS